MYENTRYGFLFLHFTNISIKCKNKEGASTAGIYVTPLLKKKQRQKSYFLPLFSFLNKQNMPKINMQ